MLWGWRGRCTAVARPTEKQGKCAKKANVGIQGHSTNFSLGSAQTLHLHLRGLHRWQFRHQPYDLFWDHGRLGRVEHSLDRYNCPPDCQFNTLNQVACIQPNISNPPDKQHSPNHDDHRIALARRPRCWAVGGSDEEIIVTIRFKKKYIAVTT